MANRKIVLLEIEVPPGQYCSDGRNGVCEHLNNHGGGASCDMSLGDPIYIGQEYHDYKKPKTCSLLKEKS